MLQLQQRAQSKANQMFYMIKYRTEHQPISEIYNEAGLATGHSCVAYFCYCKANWDVMTANIMDS